MQERRGKLLVSLLGVSLVAFLLASNGCGPRIVSGQADVKGIFEKITPGMTMDQVMNRFQPTAPLVEKVEADGQIRLHWQDKMGAYRATIKMEGGKVVEKNWEFTPPPKEEGQPPAGAQGPAEKPGRPVTAPPEEKPAEGLP